MDYKEIIPTLPGWMSTRKAEIIHDLIMASKAKVSVEIGCHGGRGLTTMASAHSKVGGIAYGIDSYSVGPCLEGTGNVDNDRYWSSEVDFTSIQYECLKSILDNGLIKYASVLKMRSDEAFMFFKRIDVLFIDGNPTKEGTCMDVQCYAPLVVSGGYLVLNNSDWDTKEEAKNLILNYGFTLYEEYQETCCGKFAIYQKISEHG